MELSCYVLNSFYFQLYLVTEACSWYQTRSICQYDQDKHDTCVYICHQLGKFISPSKTFPFWRQSLVEVTATHNSQPTLHITVRNLLFIYTRYSGQNSLNAQPISLMSEARISSSGFYRLRDWGREDEGVEINDGLS